MLEVGERFGRWTIIGEPFRRGSRTVAMCRCDCGTERVVLAQSLRRKDRGNLSCGCWRRERTATIVRETRWKNSHGRSKDPLYRLWKRIVSRCYNPRSTQWKWYGGRGIAVDPAWRKDAGAFIAYIEETLGPRPEGMSLDRIDNDGNYEPGNLRWATQKEQVHNSRREFVA